MIRRFITGFGIGFLIFIVINLLSAHLASDCGLPAVFGRDAPWHHPPRQVCADDIVHAGWPLRFYQEGGFAYHIEFNLPVLLTDLVIGITLASVIGWFVAQ